MEKQKRWQFWLIVTVVAMTLVSILPTTFYYSKPLKSPITKQSAEQIGEEIIGRLNEMEEDSKAWLVAFAKHLGLNLKSVHFDKNNPGQYIVVFNSEKDASIFQRFLPKAGNLIPFVPAQLELDTVDEEEPTKVIVSRQVNVHLTNDDLEDLFRYVPKTTEEGNISADYLTLIQNRTVQLANHLSNQHSLATRIDRFLRNSNSERGDQEAAVIAQEIVEWTTLFGQDHPATERFYRQILSDNQASELIRHLNDALSKEQEDDQTVQENRGKIEQATAHLKKFKESTLDQRINQETIRDSFVKTSQTMDQKDPIQVISLEESHPLFEKIVIDWGSERFRFKLFDDIEEILQQPAHSEAKAYQKERLRQLLLNEVARVSRQTEETFVPEGQEFAVEFHQKSNPTGFYLMDLGYLAEKQLSTLEQELNETWQPKHPDLVHENFPILSKEEFDARAPSERKLGLLLYAPTADTTTPQGIRRDSIYVVARGLESILQKHRENPNSEEAKRLHTDLTSLTRLLAKQGYFAYPGSSPGIDTTFEDDYLFEKREFAASLIKATRENFIVYGSNRDAVLELTDHEQRIIARNNIRDSIQEDLIKWSDEYASSQADIDVTRHYEVPPPTKSLFLENLKLTTAKFFQGDDRKILKWGLDLSGGKTVRIGLRDKNGKKVTKPEELNQAVNELYTRINKMGVSERTIRVENENIILDFPGSQALSAEDLVKASAMYFHIVNEKFTPRTPELGQAVNAFLQDVWNEAVVTNRKDVKSINEIAWRQLGGEEYGQTARPASDHARLLLENGLKLPAPSESEVSNAFDDSLSKIALMRGDEASEWYGQTHPLVIVFNNYALEGSNLTNIRVGYEPSEGNILTFQVKNSYSGPNDLAGGSPRDDFFRWTSQFSEDQVAGTPKEKFSHGRGWKMAVILNDAIVTMPNLRGSLREGGSITGRFSQREINELAADLKAGSLSFTPEILSEENVSPELGAKERNQGIMATMIGLLLVAVAMIGYYRFAGVIATCAVFLNILIMWAVLQSIGAALTLPGLAGIILTIGMAVDANVLVFERIREEFAISGRISSAIQAGYDKAFSAIVDSNITTIIAALILTQFDSGPIKGFAVTLIIGIVSSMFTALFVTKYFFAGWVQNPKNRELKMSQFIGKTKIDFLKFTKPALFISLIVILTGGFMFVQQRHTLFGMDFTGGYALYAQVEEQEGVDSYREIVESALLAAGAAEIDVEIRELSKKNHLRIQLGMGMEEEGRPFHALPLTQQVENASYSFQKDPRIEWVVEALQEGGITIQESDLIDLESNWSMMSGQFSDAMRKNAMYALSLALLSILIYITLRFEFKYAIAAVLALAHDVAVTLAVLALFHLAGLPVQIDLVVIGAIMTIIGYSLNDTIIIFDRIREDVRLMRKAKFTDVINHALNVTLSRTIMTSGTTLLVLLALVFLGGSSILDFSLVMTIGVVVGTISSLFLAAPLMLLFHNREERRERGTSSPKKA